MKTYVVHSGVMNPDREPKLVGTVTVDADRKIVSGTDGFSDLPTKDIYDVDTFYSCCMSSNRGIEVLGEETE